MSERKREREASARAHPQLSDICFGRMKLKPSFSHTQKCTRCQDRPQRASSRCSREDAIRKISLAASTTRTSLRGWSRERSYDHWQADRLQMCTCQVNKCYRVNNAFIWINLTASVWENSTREHSSFWVFCESYYQQMCLARLACCCQWPTVCLETHKNILWCRCWCAHNPSNHLLTHLLPLRKPRNKAAVGWLQRRAKTFCAAANVLTRCYAWFL